MARIHLLSDLHLEHGGPIERPQIDADRTVLAGDIWTRDRLHPAEVPAARRRDASCGVRCLVADPPGGAA